MTDWANLWELHGDRYLRAIELAEPLSEETFRDELLFCLLSGHSIPFELADSAARHLRAFDVFGRRRSDGELFELLSSELEMPQFYPRRRSGELRRFRFPIRKAAALVDARRWVQREAPVYASLRATESEPARRVKLLSCPGVGPKSASWILRNLGLASHLAILDVHIIRALNDATRIDGLTLPGDYEEIEARFNAWCRELAVEPRAFDLLVWDVQRGALPAVG